MELWRRPGISIASTQQNSNVSEWILRELFGFLADFLAQKPNTGTESELSYNSDDSEFNYNPGYVIDATIKRVK